MKLLFCILMIGLYFSPCSAFFWSKQDPIEVEIYSVLNGVAKEAEKKFNIRTIGTGISSPGWVLHSLSLDFQVERSLTREEIKTICKYTACLLRDRANASEILRKQMFSYPFTIKNVTVCLFIKSKNGDRLFDPEFCVGELRSGIYEFLTREKGAKCGYNNSYEEEFVE